MNIDILDVAFHQNAEAGHDFAVVLFRWYDDAPEPGVWHEHMVATVFSQPGMIAVLDSTLATHHNIRVGENSWHGEDFEPELRLIIEERKP